MQLNFEDHFKASHKEMDPESGKYMQHKYKPLGWEKTNLTNITSVHPFRQKITY